VTTPPTSLKDIIAFLENAIGVCESLVNAFPELDRDEEGELQKDIDSWSVIDRLDPIRERAELAMGILKDMNAHRQAT
jgi:hypothetical protein